MYDDWAGTVYPEGVPRRRWLETYATWFATVEINNSFYRLPEKERFEAWASSVPEPFVFAPKVSRYLSHIRRLREPAEPVERFVTHAEGLGSRLGPSLLQLPPNLRCDRGRLAAVLDRWPRRHRLALEVRHASWFDDDVLDLLHRHDVALVLTDRANHRPEPPVATASFGYVRLHRGTADPPTAYGDHALASWDERIDVVFGHDRDVFVFFNNDRGGAAVANARQLIRLGEREHRAQPALAHGPRRSR
jgi:uncharacterized protein YecE (DUF72 family)